MNSSPQCRVVVVVSVPAANRSSVQTHRFSMSNPDMESSFYREHINTQQRNTMISIIVQLIVGNQTVWRTVETITAAGADIPCPFLWGSSRYSLWVMRGHDPLGALWSALQYRKELNASEKKSSCEVRGYVSSATEPCWTATENTNIYLDRETSTQTCIQSICVSISIDNMLVIWMIMTTERWSQETITKHTNISRITYTPHWLVLLER